jgi:tripartite-type tricarboxylate transporter receptor subunit TctC
VNKLSLVILFTASALVARSINADYPTDKEITFVVPFSTGGGFDTIVRKFAPVMAADMGTPVVAKNIKGASGTRGGQAVARAKPDGYTIGIFNIPGLAVSQMMGKDIGFDLNKITWIATLASSRYGIAVSSDSPAKTLNDLCQLGRPIKLSATGNASTATIFSVIAFDFIGCPIINVTGYGGSNDAMIAVMRGDVDATLKPITTINKYVESGDLRFVVTLTDKRVFENVPSTTELGFSELAKFAVHRVVGAPEDLPVEVISRLEAAFSTAIQSETIKEWASGTKTTLNWQSSNNTAGLIVESTAFYLRYQSLFDLK